MGRPFGIGSSASINMMDLCTFLKAGGEGLSSLDWAPSREALRNPQGFLFSDIIQNERAPPEGRALAMESILVHLEENREPMLSQWRHSR